MGLVVNLFVVEWVGDVVGIINCMVDVVVGKLVFKWFKSGIWIIFVDGYFGI